MAKTNTPKRRPNSADKRIALLSAATAAALSAQAGAEQPLLLPPVAPALRDAVIARLARLGARATPMTEHGAAPSASADEDERRASMPIQNWDLTSDYQVLAPGETRLPTAFQFGMVSATPLALYRVSIGKGALDADSLSLVLTSNLVPAASDMDATDKDVALARAMAIAAAGRKRLNDFARWAGDASFWTLLGAELAPSRSSLLQAETAFTNPAQLRKAVTALLPGEAVEVCYALAELASYYLHSARVLAPSPELAVYDARPRLYPELDDLFVESVRLDILLALQGVPLTPADLGGARRFAPEALFAAIGSAGHAFATHLQKNLVHSNAIAPALELLRYSVEGPVAHWQRLSLESAVLASPKLMELQANFTLVKLAMARPPSADLNVEVATAGFERLIDRLHAVVTTSPRWKVVSLAQAASFYSAYGFSRRGVLRAAVIAPEASLAADPVLFTRNMRMDGASVQLIVDGPMSQRVKAQVPAIGQGLRADVMVPALSALVTALPTLDHDYERDRTRLFCLGVPTEDLLPLLEHMAVSRSSSQSYTIEPVAGAPAGTLQRSRLVYTVSPTSNVRAGLSLSQAQVVFTADPVLTILLTMPERDDMGTSVSAEGARSSLAVGRQAPSAEGLSLPMPLNVAQRIPGRSVLSPLRIRVPFIDREFDVETTLSALLGLHAYAGVEALVQPVTQAMAGALYRASFEIAATIQRVAFDLGQQNSPLLSIPRFRRLAGSSTLAMLRSAMEGTTSLYVRQRLLAQITAAAVAGQEPELAERLQSSLSQPEFSRMLSFKALLAVWFASGLLDSNTELYLFDKMQALDDEALLLDL